MNCSSGCLCSSGCCFGESTEFRQVKLFKLFISIFVHKVNEHGTCVTRILMTMQYFTMENDLLIPEHILPTLTVFTKTKVMHHTLMQGSPCSLAMNQPT